MKDRRFPSDDGRRWSLVRVENRTSESDKRVLSVRRRSQDCHSGLEANFGCDRILGYLWGGQRQKVLDLSRTGWIMGRVF